MTRPGLAIRPLTPSDTEAARLLATDLPYAPHWPHAVWASLLDPHAGPQRIVLGAFLAGRLAGLAIAGLTPPEAELESIAVSVESQRQGIARALLGSLDAGLRAAGVSTLLLEVRVSNAPAQALYRSVGFVQVGVRPSYYADPTEDALILSRPLV